MTKPLIGNLIAKVLLKVYYKEIKSLGKNIHLVKRLIPSKAIGMSLGDYILISQNNPKVYSTITHELVHRDQWYRFGYWGLGFLVRYLYYTIRYGYKNNPLEVEARNFTYDMATIILETEDVHFDLN